MPGRLLGLPGEFGDLGPFLFIGRSHRYRKQLTEGINRHVYLAAALTFIAVIARAGAALAS